MSSVASTADGGSSTATPTSHPPTSASARTGDRRRRDRVDREGGAVVPEGEARRGAATEVQRDPRDLPIGEGDVSGGRTRARCVSEGAEDVDLLGEPQR